MKKGKTILIAGGDLRQVHIANLLNKNGKRVYVYGFEKDLDFEKGVIEIKSLNQLNYLKYGIDTLILPVPAMSNTENINTPFSKNSINIDEVLKKIDEDTYVFAGQISNNLEEKLISKRVRYFDYLEREELAVMNAIPTAEGTLQIIIEEMPVTIYGLNVFIVGSGRISRVLRKYLLTMGAKVTVVARRYSDVAWSEIDGASGIFIKDLEKNIHKAQLVINTIPAKIFDEDILRRMQKDSLLIDLASKPGGVDFDEARKLGIKTIWALSLPGKSSPITAGEIIYSTIENIINQLD